MVKWRGRNPKGGGRHAEKTTLKGQFLRTSLAMLVLSLLIGVAVMVAVMIFFTVRVPDGEKFLMESLSFLFGKQTIGPSRMVPVLVLAGVLLCLMVTGVCILLTSRLTGRITATLKNPAPGGGQSAGRRAGFPNPLLRRAGAGRAQPLPWRASASA